MEAVKIEMELVEFVMGPDAPLVEIWDPGDASVIRKHVVADRHRRVVEEEISFYRYLELSRECPGAEGCAFGKRLITKKNWEGDEFLDYIYWEKVVRHIVKVWLRKVD
jgi:hypothetical protein